MSKAELAAIRKAIRQQCDVSDAYVARWKYRLHPIPETAFNDELGHLHAIRLKALNHWLEVVDTLRLGGGTADDLRGMIISDLVAFAQNASPSLTDAIALWAENIRLSVLGEVVSIAASYGGAGAKDITPKKK